MFNPSQFINLPYLPYWRVLDNLVHNKVIRIVNSPCTMEHGPSWVTCDLQYTASVGIWILNDGMILELKNQRLIFLSLITAKQHELHIDYNIFISWYKKHNFIKQHCTKTIWPTGGIKCNSRAACLPNTFISSISSNIFSWIINYIANRRNLSFNGHSWSGVCGALQEWNEWALMHNKLTDEYCAFKHFLYFIPTTNMFPDIHFCECSVLAVLLHELHNAAVRRQALPHSLIEINRFPQCSVLTVHHCSILRIHQKQPGALQNLQPHSHWFHTHGSAMPENDYKMQVAPAWQILSHLDFRTGEVIRVSESSHLKVQIYSLIFL